MALSRVAKRQKVQDLITLRGVTMNTVRAIIGILQPSDLTECDVDFTKRFFLQSDAYDHAKTSVTFVQQDGRPFVWRPCALRLLLPDVLLRCRGIREVFSNALRDRPPSREAPWQLILYSDEVTPGDPLTVDNRRKRHQLYASFAELGHYLRLEEGCGNGMWHAETSHLLFFARSR